ncbi:Hypothetical predicted protein [Olea europaea subsp. europaea]|uniref:Uncharacterized protein n=1 Tax=Olea europaea subsp. europaea TaxID=158383 RepID=A0A8S0TU78_OLEEU|nr:Hypothetical predicted protein [Olea europaea subsp. europaea]
MPGNQVASLSWPGHALDMAYTLCPEGSKNHPASLSCPGHGLYIVSQKCLNIRLCPCHVRDMARTPCPRNCREMPENQVASLTQSRSVPNMARTLLPKNCLEIYENQDMSLPTHPGYGLHTVPKNRPEMPENQAPSLSWLRRVLDLACTP